MKIIPLIFIIAFTTLLEGCDGKLEANGRTYGSYGFFNETTHRSSHVCYEISPLSVVVAIIFVETVIVPVYVIGCDLFNPIRLKTSPQDDCGMDY